MNEKYAPLIPLMRDFISGSSHSMSLAREIEGIIATQLDEEGWVYQELEYALSVFSPGGGEHLYDEDDLSRLFRYVLNKIENE